MQDNMENLDSVAGSIESNGKATYPKRDQTTTSISVSSELLEKARIRAAESFRTFSQYVSFLIYQDLNHPKTRS